MLRNSRNVFSFQFSLFIWRHNQLLCKSIMPASLIRFKCYQPCSVWAHFLSVQTARIAFMFLLSIFQLYAFSFRQVAHLQSSPFVLSVGGIGARALLVCDAFTMIIKIAPPAGSVSLNELNAAAVRARVLLSPFTPTYLCFCLLIMIVLWRKYFICFPGAISLVANFMWRNGCAPRLTNTAADTKNASQWRFVANI